MHHTVSAAVALALALLLAPAHATADDHAGKSATHTRVAAKAVHKSHRKHVTHRHRKRHVSRHWRGYGFLPGYVPPEVAAREREWRYWRSGPHFYGPAWPRFYRGRWNGGGFGPCYVSTPIGYMWTCGK